MGPFRGGTPGLPLAASKTKRVLVRQAAISMTGGVRRVAKMRSTGRLCMRAMPLTVLAPASGHAYAMRRFLARGIDLSLYFLIVLTFGGIVLPETFARIDSPLSLLSAYVVAVASFPAVEGQFVSFLRNTPGKALFGLRVVTSS